MKHRLFTFGCSFTNYYWPSWADILLSEFSGENWAKRGGGNKFIFESLVECHVTNQITPKDQVIVMWTSFAREDRYINNHWALYGNVYNAKPLYDEEFLNKYWSDKGSVLHNLNYISAAIEFLKSLKCKWSMCYAFPSNQFIDHSDIMLQTIQDISSFQKYFSFIYEHDEYFVSDPLMNRKYPQSTWKEASYGKNIKDSHFFPIYHYDWLSRNLLDRLEMDDSIRNKMLNFSKEQQSIWEEKEKIGIHPTLLNDPNYEVNIPKDRI